MVSYGMVMLMLVGRMDSKDTTALWARRPWLGKGRSVEKQQWSSVWVVGAGGGLGPGPGVEVETVSLYIPPRTHHTGRTSSCVCVTFQIAALYSNGQFHWLIIWEMI